MRTALLSFASLTALLLMTAGASAQGRAPFCSRMVPGEGDVIRCDFYSMDACRFDVSGRGGVCIPNPAMAAGMGMYQGRYAPRRYYR